MSKPPQNRPWLKWYPSDWRAHLKLKMCSLSARGLWIEMINIMHEAAPYGHLLIDGVKPGLGDLAAIIGRPIKEVTAAYAELQHRGVFSLTGEGVPYSRKMVRDKAKADENVDNGLLGGNPDIPRGAVPKTERVRPFRRSDAPEKTRRIFSMHNGHCHWCRRALLFHPDGTEAGFHIDHVRAICDGGTNDESNLVPSCAACNHARVRMTEQERLQQSNAVRVGWTDPVLVGSIYDTKAHMPEARDSEEKTDANASVKKESRRGRATAIDLETWEPDDADREYAFAQGRDAERILADIRGWAANQPPAKRRKPDPRAFWQGWCRRAADRGECGLGGHGQRPGRASSGGLVAAANEIIAADALSGRSE